MPFRLGPWEIALIVVIILIVFGVGKLPQIGGAMGRVSVTSGKGSAVKTLKRMRKRNHPNREKPSGNHRSNNSIYPAKMVLTNNSDIIYTYAGVIHVQYR